MGGAIHKGACKLNSTDCNNTPKCFIKKLYEQLQVKEHELIMAKANLCKGCQYKSNYKIKEQECERLSALVTEAEEAPICFHCGEEPCIKQKRDKYKQALDTIREYCKYLTVFNKSNKTNKGLDIINNAEENN